MNPERGLQQVLSDNNMIHENDASTASAGVRFFCTAYAYSVEYAPIPLRGEPVVEIAIIPSQAGDYGLYLPG